MPVAAQSVRAARLTVELPLPQPNPPLRVLLVRLADHPRPQASLQARGSAGVAGRRHDADRLRSRPQAQPASARRRCGAASGIAASSAFRAHAAERRHPGLHLRDLPMPDGPGSRRVLRHGCLQAVHRPLLPGVRLRVRRHAARGDRKLARLSRPAGRRTRLIRGVDGDSIYAAAARAVAGSQVDEAARQ